MLIHVCFSLCVLFCVLPSFLQALLCEIRAAYAVYTILFYSFPEIYHKLTSVGIF